MPQIPEQLSQEQRDLMETIGAEAYSKLVERYGGCSVYICKQETLDRITRNEEIRQQFDGGNYRELARKYRLTENAIRDIVAPKVKELQTAPEEGQLTLWE